MENNGKINNNTRSSVEICPQIETSAPKKRKQSHVDLEGSMNVFLSPENSVEIEMEENKKGLIKKYANNFKTAVLVCTWIICSCALMSTSEKIQSMHQISIPKKATKNYFILNEPTAPKIKIMLEGALIPPYYGNLSTHWMTIWVQLLGVTDIPQGRSLKSSKIQFLGNISEIWKVPIVSARLIGVVPEVTYKKTFNLESTQIGNQNLTGLHNVIRITFQTNLRANFPVSMGYNLQPINTDNGIIYAALVLFGLYFLIIFELVHRTLAAMLASTMSVAILAALNARPTMSEIISWIDVETLLLLFSMMTLVTILSETGIFDYMSVLSYKITGGKIWPLINTLCIITTVMSCFLDNVTTALLITPVTIRLCEVMKLNPVSVLIYMLIFTNLGGAITPIGDPPNVIIASNSDVMESGVNFGVFTLHMGVGVILAFLVVYLQLRYTYRDINHFKYSEPKEVRELRREIAVYQRVAASVSSYSKDEENVKNTFMKRSATLMGQLKMRANSTATSPDDNYNINLKDLEKQYPIRDKVLLIKSGCTLLLVICVFFLHSIPAMSRLGLGWTALLGALLLLLLYDKEYLEGIFSRVEWSTLLFFASLFILMEALSRLGLIEWIGLQTQTVIMSVKQESRLTVAIILILWVSGIASAFVDNLPLTTMMIRIATNLADNRELGLPLQPLIWALSFGACFGGNGTLFGSSANIVCAGVAEQHGYRFAFLEFMKVGFPVVITSLSVISVYLIVCHVVFQWQ